MQGVHVEYARVPYWRALRPRYVWLGVGFGTGLIIGFAIGVCI